MNWSFGGGWQVVIGLVFTILAIVWFLDRRRLLTACRQIRLRAEAESDRLRLRLSALKPVEARALDLQTELAGLRPTAARVPDLEEQLADRQSVISQRDEVIVELEREAAGLRARLVDVEQTEAEMAELADRNTELGEELALATERLLRLERIDAQFVAGQEEIGRLSDRLEAAVERERELSRQVGALTESAERDREAAAVAQSRADAAEDLIARRDEIIMVLEQRLAGLPTDPSPPTADLREPAGMAEEVAATNGSADKAIGAAPDGRDAAKLKRKRDKAERKEAKKRAKRMQQAANEAAAREAAEQQAQADASPAVDEFVGDPAAVEAASGVPVDVAADEEAHVDDLQVINGIGPVMERTLNELGIRRFQQLADLDDAGAAALSGQLPGLPGRVERDGWVAQARDELATDRDR